MANFYADENFRKSVVDELRRLGHDVLTSSQAGHSNIGFSDDAVIQFAVMRRRIILTFNRKHFIKFHKMEILHWGIVVCTEDKDNLSLAKRIHEAVANFSDDDFKNTLIRINRPNS